MTEPTPEAITPAQEAWFDYRKDYGSWHQPELSQRHSAFIAGFETAARRIIDTDEELQAAPDRIIVQAADGTVAARYNSERGVLFGDNRSFPWSVLRAPAVVLLEATL